MSDTAGALQFLVVENNHGDAVLLRMMLEESELGEFELFHVRTLTAAIEHLADQRCDAVLLALSLPDAQGIEALRRLREHFPNVPVVVISEDDSESLALEAIAVGAQDYLTKGRVDVALLKRTLRYALVRHSLEVRLRESETELRALFDNNPQPAWVFDMQTLRFLAVNAAAMLLYGYTREQFLAMTIVDIQAADEVQRLKDVIAQSQLSASQGEKWRHRRKDGSAILAEINFQTLAFRGREACLVLSRDVTVQRRVIEAMQASEKRFRDLFEHSLGLICIHDLEGILLSVNPAAATALGYSVGDAIGRNLSEFMPPELGTFFADYLKRITATQIDSGLFVVLTCSGERRFWEYRNQLYAESEHDAYVVGHALDVTERRLYEKRLREQSLRDPLTGCYNRRYLEEYEKGINKQSAWGCIVLDLDYFKQINDTHGHERGDEVLTRTGRFLMRHARDCDAVLRLGGDEFMLLLNGADVAVTTAVVERLKQVGPEQAPTSFSLGWAVRENEERIESSMHRADRDLYHVRACERAVHPDRRKH